MAEVFLIAGENADFLLLLLTTKLPQALAHIAAYIAAAAAIAANGTIIQKALFKMFPGQNGTFLLQFQILDAHLVHLLHLRGQCLVR